MEKAIQETLKGKAKVEKDHASVKPTVINDTLIKAYIKTYHRENQIYDQDNLQIWNLTHLSLDYASE
jgi:predicted membrane protein